MRPSDFARYLLTILLLVCVWLQYWWAAPLIVTLLALANELHSWEHDHPKR